jgi:hypothetical protein
LMIFPTGRSQAPSMQIVRPHCWHFFFLAPAFCRFKVGELFCAFWPPCLHHRQDSLSQHIFIDWWLAPVTVPFDRDAMSFTRTGHFWSQLAGELFGMQLNRGIAVMLPWCFFFSSPQHHEHWRCKSEDYMQHICTTVVAISHQIRQFTSSYYDTLWC